MENKKVTAQDIADKLNISRNTVSKALNNSGNISEDTRNKVIQTAMELGYKQFSNATSDILFKHNEIALFTNNVPGIYHFGSSFLSGFEKQMSNYGIKLSMYVIRQDDLENLRLPNNFDPGLVDGILCIEMFDKDYSNLISNLNVPTLFIDSSPIRYNTELNADILLMENFNSVYNLTNKLLKNNITKIGFIGDINHCQSFYERWQGYYLSLLDNGINFTLENSILENDANPYNDSVWLLNKLKKLPDFPKAFICANDYIAISLINTLKTMNYSVPDDILVCGFDDSSMSKIIEPKLTTITIPSYKMGDIAANLLISRIKNPSTPYKTTYVKTSVVYRESTGKIENL